VRGGVGQLQPLTLAWLAPALWLALVVHDAVSVWRGEPFDEAWIARHCPADVILVLGAAQYDGRPSVALARRLEGAARLHRAGCSPLIVVSGGLREGDRFSEGAAGVAYLATQGLPAAALVAEEAARTTLESLVNVDARFAGARYLVVTDDLHAHRTAVFARRLGLDADVAAVRVGAGRSAYAWREVRALLAYRLGVFR
jgi:uncharacterized SAM-binding protein YcdF (DUF218 family)